MEDRPNSAGADPVVTQLFDALTERLTEDIQSGKPIRGSLLAQWHRLANDLERTPGSKELADRLRAAERDFEIFTGPRRGPEGDAA